MSNEEETDIHQHLLSGSDLESNTRGVTDAGTSIVTAYALDPNSDTSNQLHSILASFSCFECTDVYHKTAYAITDQVATAVFRDKDAARVSNALRSLDADTPRERRMRYSMIALEVLSHPYNFLSNSETDELFTHALVVCQREKVLKLRTGLMPGLIILAAHKNDPPRSWALSSLGAMDPSRFTSGRDFDALFPVLRILVDKLKAAEDDESASDLNTSSDKSILWTCLASTLSCFTLDAVKVFMEQFPGIDSFTTDTLLSNHYFPHVLTCFAKFRNASPSIPNQPASSLVHIWTTILNNNWFQMIVKTSLWLDDASPNTNAADFWTACFSWMDPLISSLFALANLESSSDSNEAQNLLLNTLGASELWTSNAQLEFARIALAPILSRTGSLCLSKPILDKLCARCLVTAPPKGDPEMALTHVVLECLDSDMDTLEQAFQDIYRDCSGFDPQNPGAALIHSESWRSLVTAGSNRPVLFKHVFKSFGRVFLFDKVNLERKGAPEGGWTDSQKKYMEAFNRGVNDVWVVVHRSLGYSALNVSLSDMLYCLVCRSNEISDLAANILIKRASSESCAGMLHWLTTKNEQNTVETIIDILNTFRDLTAMGGPPLLGCAERIQSLLIELYTLVFESDESYRFNTQKPNLWIKTWPFLSAILKSSAQWAKQDLSIKKDIKGIIAGTFEIVRLLLRNSNSLTSELLIASAQYVYMDTIFNMFQWYRVLDDKIREEAVSVSLAYLKVAEGFRYNVGDTLLETILTYTDGSLKSRLTDAQKQVLEDWVIRFLDRMDAKKAKTVEPVPVLVPPKQKTVDVFFKKEEAVTASGAVRRKADDVKLPQPAKLIKVTETVKKAPAPKLELHPSLQAGKSNEPAAPAPVSKLSQLRLEHLAEQKRLQNEAVRKRNIAAIIARGDSSDSESDFRTVTGGIKILDADMNVVDSSAVKKKPAPAPVPKKPTRLRNLNELFKVFLKWRVDDSGDVPADFPFELRSIPARFENNDDYGNVFEPLLLLECWEQFKTSVEETDFSKHFAWTLDECLMVDEFHDITFVQQFEDTRGRISDADLVFIQQTGGASSSDRKSFLGKVQKMWVRKGESTYIVRVFLKNNHTVVPLLFNNSKWNATKLFSMTTVLREYESLLSLPKVALCSEIITPLYRKKLVLKEGSVERAMSIFGANRPQAEAIATATQRTNGFVLIQGPPGTGKTKTILSLVGSLLTTAATAISAPGAGNAIKAPGGGTAIRAPGGGTAIRAPGGGNAIRAPGGGTAIRGPASSMGARGGVIASKTAGSATGKKNRLLICAPSNAACDEIVRRLKAGILNAQGKEFQPKIVRLGTSDSIGPDIRDLTIEALVKEKLAADAEYRKLSADTTDNSQWVALEKHQSELIAEREALRVKEKKETNSIKELELITNAIGRVTEKLKTVDEKFKSMKQKRLEREGSADHVKARVKASVLLDADVIMATLSGAGHEIMSTLQNFEFPTVIIDEACQSVELSSLIPLRYGCKKCIMVGDPMQLPPTVLSPAAKRYGYENSLFQRVMGLYGDSVCLLSIQYRMHPHISVFPSAQFYGSRLIDADNMEVKCTADWHGHDNYPAYRFLNIGWGRELRERHSLYNPDEIVACVNFVARLCASFPSLSFASRIGVITPYRMHMLKMRDKFKERFGANILDYVDINTIDAFQGREKDIIILSTVRAGLGQAIGFLKDKRRMNVALTRAKNSLFILGREVSLSNNDDWRALVEDCQARKMFFDLDRKEFGPSAKITEVTNLKE
ncbi:DEAD-box type RNA helicase [Chytriomyces hyalinus]|nr:DEAD-box type RNA helicase [Chytriomyces hyalinus]